MDVHENAKMAQSVFLFEFWHSRLVRDTIDVRMPKWPIFDHVLVGNATMAQFKREKQLGHFDILMHIHISVTAILGHFGNHRSSIRFPETNFSVNWAIFC